MEAWIELECSDGKIIQNPGKTEADDTIAKIGNELDFCILSDGDDFIQTAASDGGLLVQYKDAGGMFESARSDFDCGTVQDFFRQFLDRKDDWKSSAEFTTMDSGETASDAGASENSRAAGPKKSLKETLMDSVKNEAVNSVNRAAKKVTRNLFRKLF